jgi:cytosine/adenosine deaminase-related metal-dependent hydrolase
MKFWSPLENLQETLICEGGIINSHAHLDRAYTVNSNTMQMTKNHLYEKWKLVDDIKRTRSVEDYAEGISLALEMQKFYGVKKVCSFIDIDPIVKHKALDGALLARDKAIGSDLIIACQTLKGILNPSSRDLIEDRIGDLDILGSLPGADKGQEEMHLDTIMEMARSYNKMVHVHVDQLNSPSEKETELLCRKTIEWGMEGKVVAVHSISLAAHPKKYRKEVYKMAQDAGMMFITCPTAWIDHPRTEELMPFHNAITPVDELLEHNLIVAIGSDNIHDIYKPYSNGDMITELRFLLECCKIYDQTALKTIAIDNGLKVLGA